MTNDPSSSQTPRSVAEALMQERLDLVDAHAANVATEKSVRDQLADLERVTARSWADLLAAGWTPDELKRMNFKEPKVKAPGRPRSRGRGDKAAPTTNPTSEARAVPAQPAPSAVSPEPARPGAS